MSIEKGRAFFRALGMEDRVIEFDVSSATVALAAEALNRTKLCGQHKKARDVGYTIQATNWHRNSSGVSFVLV